MVKHVKLILIMTFMFVLIFSTKVLALDNEDDYEKAEAMNVINQVRVLYGIPVIRKDVNLENASLNHSTYMYRCELLTSVEDSLLKGFTGKYPWDRARSSGYIKSLILEYIDKDEVYFVDSINNFIDNPYTRQNLFNPKYTDYAVGAYKNYITHILGGAVSTIANYTYEVTYPYNGQKNVPTEYNPKIEPILYNTTQNSEAQTAYGYPITYTYYSSATNIKIEIDKTTTQLYMVGLDQTKQKVATKYLTPDEDKSLLNTVVILPTKLEENKNYELDLKLMVTVDGKVKQVVKKITFSTDLVKSVDENLLNDLTKVINRAEFCKILVDLLELPLVKEYNEVFTDVAASDYYAPYILTAYQYGLINGIGEGLFGPNSNLTRQQIVTIIVRAYEKLNATGEILSENVELSFDDVNQISNWALSSMKKAYGASLVYGTGMNKLEPQRDIKLHEAQLFVKRVKAKMEQQLINTLQ